MVPKAPCIAPGHAYEVRHPGHLRGEMSRHSIGLHVMRENDVKRLLGMSGRSDGGELGNERAGHRDIRLRPVDRIGPMHFHRTRGERRRASLPICLSHVHAEWRAHFFRIGDDMHLVTALREGTRSPIGPHADTALDRREFADDADSHPLTSRSPAVVKSAISSSASGDPLKAAPSVQAARTSNKSKTAGGSSKIRDWLPSGEPTMASLVARSTGASA